MTKAAEHLAAVAADAPEGLAGCDFTEIYLSGSASSPPIVRDLSWHGNGRRRSRTVDHVPREFRRDAAAILRAARESARGSESVVVRHDGVRYRCSPMWLGKCDREAETWAVRRIRKDPMPLDDLGVPPSVLRRLKRFEGWQGLLLVCGSFGSGKTTTTSSVLDHWVASTREVGVTFEDPPEFDMERMTGDRGMIRQVDVSDEGYPAALSAARRWAPRFVMVGEIRSPEAAAETLHMAISGPMVATTIHGSSPVNAIMSLARYASAAMSERDARQMASNAIAGVVHQRASPTGPEFSFLSVGEREADRAVRLKIESGEYHKIEEDMVRQGRLREIE